MSAEDAPTPQNDVVGSVDRTMSDTGPVVSPDATLMDTPSAVMDAVELDTPRTSDVPSPRDVSVDVRSSPDVIADAGGCQVTSDRATWVVTAEPAVDAAMRTALFAMFAQRRVTRVYIDVGRLLDSASGRTSLAAYVRELHSRCISVEFLFGNRFRVDQPVELRARADAAVAYAAGNPTAVPDALHFDLEPHVYPGFPADPAAFAAVAAQYVDALDMLGPVVRGARMRFHVDIAHWYGSRMYTRAGRTAALDRWVAERVDGYAVMDYWGAAADAATTARIITQTRSVDTASAVGISAWVGLQVECGGPANETLCEEGTAYTESVITSVRNHFAGNATFRGVAFYAHSGLGTLRP